MYKFELTDSAYELCTPLVDIEPVVLANAYEAFPDLDETDLAAQLRVEQRFLNDLRISNVNVTELIIANSHQVLCATFAQGCGDLYDTFCKVHMILNPRIYGWPQMHAGNDKQSLILLIA
ncbi:MAG: hypothetical protein WBP26_02830 [Candidatus Saccharimonadales bacterium]